jgi:hypothetical protein
MSILSELGGSLRFDVAGKTRVDQVLSASDLNDTQHPLPNIRWEKTKKCENEVFSIEPTMLDPKTDALYLNLYLLEFRGNRERALQDSHYLVAELMNTLQNLRTLFDIRILGYFHWIWISSPNVDAYETKLNDMRKAANNYWLEQYLNATKSDSGSLVSLINKPRALRLAVLKEHYKTDYQNYIWRILDTNDIGLFLLEYCPEFKKNEERKVRAAADWPRGMGPFSNMNAILESHPNPHRI